MDGFYKLRNLILVGINNVKHLFMPLIKFQALLARTTYTKDVLVRTFKDV